MKPTQATAVEVAPASKPGAETCPKCGSIGLFRGTSGVKCLSCGRVETTQPTEIDSTARATEKPGPEVCPACKSVDGQFRGAGGVKCLKCGCVRENPGRTFTDHTARRVANPGGLSGAMVSRAAELGSSRA